MNKKVVHFPEHRFSMLHQSKMKTVQNTLSPTPQILKNNLGGTKNNQGIGLRVNMNWNPMSHPPSPRNFQNSSLYANMVPTQHPTIRKGRQSEQTYGGREISCFLSKSQEFNLQVEKSNQSQKQYCQLQQPGEELCREVKNLLIDIERAQEANHQLKRQNTELRYQKMKLLSDQDETLLWKLKRQINELKAKIQAEKQDGKNIMLGNQTGRMMLKQPRVSLNYHGQLPTNLSLTSHSWKFSQKIKTDRPLQESGSRMFGK